VEAANLAAIGLARALLSRFIVVHAHRKRLSGGSAFGPSSDEVARTLSGGATSEAAGLAIEEQRVAAAHAAFDAALGGNGSEPPLGRLRRVFSLSKLDLTIVALLLAPELDHELERAFTFALDDFTRKRGDIGFLARVIGAVDARLADEVLIRLGEDGPLRRHSVVAIASNADVSATMRPARVADRIVAFVRGHDTLDELVHGLIRVAERPPALDAVVMSVETLARIERALDSAPNPRVLLAGPDGVGRALAVEALLGTKRRGCVRIDLAGIVAEGKIPERVAAGLREAALRDAAAIIEGGSLGDDVPRPLAHALADGAAGLAVPIVFALASRPAWIAHAVPDLLELDVPPPSFRERVELWRRAIPPPLATQEDLETVASRYAFTGASIMRCARRAIATAKLRGGAGAQVTLDDLGDAARLMFTHRLGGMAQRIPTGFKWDDLVLPKDTLDAVREVVRFARYRPFLLEDWGFAAKLPYGRGISAILAGPPGTGKTMVAQLLAKELGFDLYRIDLSQVVNKYIGETEKNLARIFDEAETSHAVLFFDEADSLFSKRTDVKSSNDRYANLEVNYLLQRMETYDGVTLLATNLEQGLDEAFKRRVRFSVQFELPEEDERRKLWRSMFPPRVPLDPDIDWDLIAKKFEMAGGYIKKAVLRAALMAAETQRPLTTADLVEAARQEYREMGRII
jgi:SpoVK/Ycf46/Vps4 family AAA+-type ATPase